MMCPAMKKNVLLCPLLYLCVTSGMKVASNGAFALLKPCGLQPIWKCAVANNDWHSVRPCKLNSNVRLLQTPVWERRGWHSSEVLQRHGWRSASRPLLAHWCGLHTPASSGSLMTGSWGELSARYFQVLDLQHPAGRGKPMRFFSSGLSPHEGRYPVVPLWLTLFILLITSVLFIQSALPSQEENKRPFLSQMYSSHTFLLLYVFGL